MNEYIPIHPNTLTGIADEVRRLGNIDDKVTTEQMIRISANTADEVDIQTALIQQIKAGLTEAEENMGRTNNEISTQSAIIQQIKSVLVEKGYQTAEE
jgi:predicted transcriptional regulator